MRAFVLESFDEQPVLREDVPEPSVGENHVLVRVHASSVNPVDVLIAAGVLRQYAEYELPVTIGRDFAGVVERVSSGVSRYHVGDEVFGFVLHANPTVRDGSWAELIALPDDLQVGPKPSSLSLAEAGATGVAGLAALGAVDALGLAEGETVLVIGASGGRGQHLRPARSRRGRTRDRSCPPRGSRLPARGWRSRARRSERRCRRDCAGSASTLGAAGEGPGRFNIVGEPTPANLQRLAELFDAGTLRVHVEREYPLEQAGEALQALPGTHTRGKIGLTIA